MEIDKIEKTFDRPIFLVKLFSIFMVVDCITGILYQGNLLDLFKKNDIPADVLFPVIFGSLTACFIIKAVLGACGKKIFLRFGNHLVYNGKGISKSIESWQKEAYKINNQYAIVKLNNYKQSLLIEENCFVDIFINIILFVIYLFYSIKTKVTIFMFLSHQPFFLWLIIVYVIILGVIVYSLFSKKDKMIIEMQV